MWTVFVRDREGRDVARADLTRAPVTVGRDPDRGLVLPSPAVSRRHARLSIEGGRVVIADEGSANGVKVDGRRISIPTPVGAETLIEVAEFVLRVVPTTGAAAAAVPPGPIVSAGEVAARAGVIAARPASSALGGLGDATVPFEQVAEPISPDLTLPPGSTESIIASAPPLRQDLLSTLPPSAGVPQQVTLSGALAAVEGAGVRLVGRGGPYDARAFELVKPEMFVGRVSGNDIVLDDSSISRRHARLRLLDAGARVEVFDLRSANGTFVNGERIKLEACGPGDKLRFGDLLFRVESTASPPPGSTQVVGSQGRKRRAVLIGVAAFVLLSGIIGGALWKRFKKPVETGPDPRERLAMLQTQVQERINTGKIEMKRRRWTAAEEAFSEALELDPLHEEAQSLKRKVHAEIEYADIFKQANESFELATRPNLERARDLYKQIPPHSYYHGPVKYKLRQINRSLAETHRVDGLSQLKARYYQRAHTSLCTFFELLGDDDPTPGEDRVREGLARTEKRLRRSRSFKPCTASRYLGRPKVAGVTVDPEEELKAKYPNSKLRAALILYHRGRIDPALKALNRVEKDRSLRELLPTVREVRRNFEIVRGKFEEGFSKARERRADEARREWDYVLDADRVLLPKTLESFYRREITRLLGDLYYELGDDDYKRQRYREAFGRWRIGLRVAPKHGQMLNGMLRLEEEARKAIDQAAALPPDRARAKLELARDITVPTSRVHKAARAKLGP